MTKYKTLLTLILWRLFSVFVVQTPHVPDEYWQSLEVAHKLAFDYGYLTWEWLWGIRSYMYPFLISLLYKLLDILHLDYVELLLIMPRVFQAFLSGYADYRFYLWTNKSKMALLCFMCNWYWYFCATRTLINTVETTITTIALTMFPWQGHQTGSFLWLVGFLCLARPTAAILWLPLCLYYLFTRESGFYATLTQCSLIGATSLAVSTLIDTLHYKRFVITPWEFLKSNVVLQISDFYGVHSLLWYLYSGLPVVLGLNCLLLPTAAYRVCKRCSYYHKQFVLLVSAIWTLFVYSLLPHKEFRFVLPLLPVLLYITSSVPVLEVSRKTRKIITVVFLVTNLVPGLYFSFLHMRGSLDVMKFLRRQLPREDSAINLLFLTPCHAVPLYSHLHRNVSTRFLTCEPNFRQVEGYIDEADRFFAEPMKWLDEEYREEEQLPSHLIVFDNVVDKISPFLKHYDALATIFYAHFPEGKTEDLQKLDEKMDEKLDEKMDEKLDEKMDEKLDEKMDEKLDEKMDEKLDEKLDNLVLLNLELMEQKVAATMEMEKSLRNAQIELAKAKMIRGKEAIGTTQIPIHMDNVTSLFELESVMTDQDGKPVPQFDISLKPAADSVQNPLKWFGILVPQSLRSAQKYFQESIYQSVKVANIQAKLIGVLDEMEVVKGLKNDNGNRG